jgi:autotransporter-associated beta strand protein
MNQRIPLMAVWISLLLLAGTPLRSVSTEGNTVYTWTGNSSSSYFYNAGNWAGGEAPPEDGTANILFGDLFRTYLYYGEINVNQLAFISHTRPYFLEGEATTTYIGAGGIVYSPTLPVRSNITGTINFTADQTWDITNGTLVLQDYLQDGENNYTFTKTGAGTLVFGRSDNGFCTSTINLNNGRLVLVAPYDSYGDRPLGWADLVIGPTTGGANPALVAARNQYGYDDPVTLDNAITLNGILATENKVELLLTGPVTLNADTTIKSQGAALFIEGNIGEDDTARKLTVDSAGAVILTGANSYTGDTTVTKGVLIFGNVDSMPQNNLEGGSEGKLIATANSYMGIAFVPAGEYANATNTLFLSHFDKSATSGTIGFDTDPEEGGFNDFTDDIDLTGFGITARLGSATNAILSGTITPQGTNYRFGGGGGFLQVNSKLTDQTTPTTAARSLVLDSPAALPLTVQLTNSANDYTGGTSVTNSGLILGNDDTNANLPAGTGNISINAGGYVGFRDWGDNSDSSLISSSLAKINPASVGMVGFDQVYSLSAAVDLSSFSNALYLGTATWFGEGPGLSLSGTITPAGGGSAPYRFAGFKGGALEIASTLTGANGVHIGDPNSPGTFGDYFNQEYSTVALTGNNTTLTGNVTLYGGRLLVGQSNGTPGTDPTTALGTGTLVVAGMTLPAEWQGTDDEPPAPQLGTTDDGLLIPNNITLNTELNVGGDNSFTLAGNISGTGELYVGEDSVGDFTLGLDGNNTFSGGVYVAQGAIINAGSNTALGTGPVGFGYSGGIINFQTAAPVIGSLMVKDDNDYADLYTTQNNTVLTINQSIDGKFQGAIRLSAIHPDYNLRVVKNGTGTLRLDDGAMYFYNGTIEATLPGTPEVSLQVNAGTLVFSDTFDISATATTNLGTIPTITPTTFWINGGTLAVDGGAQIDNPLVISSGRLAGHGSFTSDVSIGSGAVLSPGLAGQGEIGTLQFSHLELNGDGTLEWQVQNPAPDGQAGRDLVRIYSEESYTLVINATAESPFSVKIISLSLAGVAGELSGFDPSQSYTWTLFDYDYLAGGFDPAKFTIDTSGFANSLAFDERGNGFFSLSLYSSSEYNNQVMLNFTPVPEPSTYALLALGLGLIGWSVWRRRT